MYRDACCDIVQFLDADELQELLELDYEAEGLADEAGEVLGKIKKLKRDLRGDISNPAFQAGLKKEMGDVLYYFSRLCYRFGWGYEELMQENMTKLLDRKERGVLQGSGDNR